MHDERPNMKCPGSIFSRSSLLRMSFIKSGLSSLLLVTIIGCDEGKAPEPEVPTTTNSTEISNDPGPVPEGQSEPTDVSTSEPSLIDLPDSEAAPPAETGGPSFPSPAPQP